MWTASQSQGQPSKARKNQAKGKRPRRFFPANASTTSGRATRARVSFDPRQVSFTPRQEARQPEEVLNGISYLLAFEQSQCILYS